MSGAAARTGILSKKYRKRLQQNTRNRYLRRVNTRSTKKELTTNSDGYDRNVGNVKLHMKNL